MQQYLFITVTTFSHDCRAYLTKPYSMAPSSPNKGKTLRNALLVAVKSIDDKSRTIKVTLAKCTANLKFFADNKRQFLSHNP